MFLTTSLNDEEGTHGAIHRLQLSRNLRDSPGFVEFVPGPGQSYYRSIVCPGSGAAPIKAIARTCKFVVATDCGCTSTAAK